MDADVTKVQVIVEGTAERVTIDSMEIDVQHRAEPLRGAHALCQVGGASASPREILVELDPNPPRVRYFSQGGDPSEPFLFTLGKDEAETFRIYAVAAACYCEWVASLHYVVDGKRMTLAIDDGGEPFRTTGSRDAQNYIWSEGAWSKQAA